MAELSNDTGAMRFALVLVARTAEPPRGPAATAGQADLSMEPSPVTGRVLATAGLDYLDARDREWWPMVRLPPLQLEAEAVEHLLRHQAELLRGATTGFAWRPGGATALALQLGTAPGGAVVEVGLDLGGFLADSAGVPPRADEDLALFRFRALQQDLVRFADALGRELEELRA